MSRTGNPIRDFESYDRDHQRYISQFPCCVYCRQHIQTDLIIKLDDGVYACEDCINERSEHLDDFVCDMEFNGGY